MIIIKNFLWNMLENDIDYQRMLLKEAELKLHPAKIVLRIISVIHILLGLIFLSFTNGLFLIVPEIFLLIGAVFLVISFTINKKPFISSVLGLIFYMLLIALYTFGGTFSGFILIFILILMVPLGLWYMIIAIKSSKNVKELRSIVNNIDGKNMPLDLIQ